MSATLAPFGFVPVEHPTGFSRARPYPIAAAYATAIAKGQPVLLDTAGVVQAAGAAVDIIGIFAGCEYVDGTGKPTVSNNWPAGGVTNGTKIIAYVWDNPDAEYLVQADGIVALTALGDQADVSNSTNAFNGLSQATLSATLKGAAVQGQFRILDFDRSVDNVAGDAFTKVIVGIARHQYIANKVAI